MAEPNETSAKGTDRPAPEKAPATPPASADAAKAQREEAREEGADKRAVPVEELTTANDSGQG